MPTIYSTATNNTVFNFYKENKEEVSTSKTISKPAKVDKSIIVNGSLSQEIPSLRGKYGQTEISKEDLELLKTNYSYKKMLDEGFISEKKPEIETLKKDKSSQLTKENISTKAKVKTGKED